MKTRATHLSTYRHLEYTAIASVPHTMIVLLVVVTALHHEAYH